jgi:hypothetical protein
VLLSKPKKPNKKRKTNKNEFPDLDTASVPATKKKPTNRKPTRNGKGREETQKN